MFYLSFVVRFSNTQTGCCICIVLYMKLLLLKILLHSFIHLLYLLINTPTRLQQNNESICHQMIMGAGKTTIVGPLLAMILADAETVVMEVGGDARYFLSLVVVVIFRH